MSTSIIKINKQNIPIKEYCGLRVVTFKDVDAVHNRPDDTARKAFNRNKRHFKKNVDYFVLKTDEAQELLGIAAPNGLTLLAESGYLMLVKPFTDDLSWDVQRQLVNLYFRAKAERTGQPTEYHRAIAEAKLYNARARVSGQWLKIAERVKLPEYQQICAHYASNVLAGREVIPLPETTEPHYTAKEIGDMFGITPQKVGIISNREGLKTERYGKWYHDKSPYSSKEVDAFKYNAAAIERFKELLQT